LLFVSAGAAVSTEKPSRYWSGNVGSLREQGISYFRPGSKQVQAATMPHPDRSEHASMADGRADGQANFLIRDDRKMRFAQPGNACLSRPIAAHGSLRSRPRRAGRLSTVYWPALLGPPSSDHSTGTDTGAPGRALVE
jgi:hypothetical protein